jgi:DNA-binding XRE family transcriptional regulator
MYYNIIKDSSNCNQIITPTNGGMIMDRKIDKKSLNHVKEIRIQENLTIKELALASGLEPSTILRIEKGLRIPNQFTMICICEGLKKDIKEVFVTNLENVKFV